MFENNENNYKFNKQTCIPLRLFQNVHLTISNNNTSSKTLKK